MGGGGSSGPTNMAGVPEGYEIYDKEEHAKQAAQGGVHTGADQAKWLRKKQTGTPVAAATDLASDNSTILGS